MPYKEILTNTIPFQVYSFDAVFTAIQPYLKEGFKFDLESNENYPQMIGTISTFCIQEYETVEVEYPTEPEAVAELPAEDQGKEEAKDSPVATSRRAKATKGI
jgi:hypothetical protein